MDTAHHNNGNIIEGKKVKKVKDAKGTDIHIGYDDAIADVSLQLVRYDGRATACQGAHHADHLCVFT